MSGRSEATTALQREDAASLTDEHFTAVQARRRRLAGINRYTGLVLWALIIALFAAWVPSTFLSDITFKNIAGGQAVTVVLALGVLFTLAAGQYDLSIAQNLGFSAVLDAYLMVQEHCSAPVAALITLLTGVGVGLINGFLVVALGINSFIATLGTSAILLSMTELLSGDQFIGPVSSNFQKIASPNPLGVPILAFYALGLAIIVWYLLEHTPFGRRMHATGANVNAARLAGVRVDAYRYGALTLGGLFASLAGLLVVAKIGSVSPTLGPAYLLPSFAACFLGTTQIKLGRFNVWGSVLAIYLLATGVTGLQLVGGQAWITDLFNGAALILAVGIAVASQGGQQLKLGRRRNRQRNATGREQAA